MEITFNIIYYTNILFSLFSLLITYKMSNILISASSTFWFAWSFIIFGTNIALIGAGAYGMPLAYEIKKMGKKAIHIGGSLQCLFGIKGSRWEAPVYNYNNLYYNENWIRPNENEKPKTAEKVENACYW